MHSQYLPFLLLFLAQPVLGQPFTDSGQTLTGVRRGAVEWADFDLDGDLDLVIAGENSGGASVTKLYRNTAGVFTEVSASLPGVERSDLEWGDYDNDGDLDLLLAGGGGGRIVRVYRNTTGTFSLAASMTGVSFDATVDWGDYDNDGDLDVILAGQLNGGNVTEIWRNDSGTFVKTSIELPGIQNGQLEWGDYDKDGDLDLALTGAPWFNNTTRITRIYRNDGGTYVDIEANLPAAVQNGLSWNDYDGDGDLDLALCGGQIGFFYTRLYRNDAGTFVDTGETFESLDNGQLEWGDYDNDGDPDLLILGATSSGAPTTRLYEQGAAGFSEVVDGLPGLKDPAAAWGDFDGDGDLDLALCGEDSGGTYLTRIYVNNAATANTPPTPPGGLVSTSSNTRLNMAWGAGSDAQTPAAALSYNLRLGTTPGGQEIVAAQASLATGLRQLVERGFAQHRRGWSIGNLPAGTYYWAVQSIDSAGAGSAWSGEQTVTLTGAGLTLSSPNGGETWGWGISRTISWISSGVVGNVTIDLSTDDGLTWSTLATVPAGLSSASLTPPNSTSTACRMRVYQASTGITDGSDERFLLAAETVKVLGPKGGEVWKTGSAQSITWAADNLAAVSIELTRNNGGSWEVLAPSVPAASGTFSWTVAGAVTRDARIRVRDAADGDPSDQSALRFATADWPFLLAYSLEGLHNASIQWADADGDGDLDLAVQGSRNASKVIRIYRNDSPGFTLAYSGGGNNSGDLLWVDEDRDGDMDIWATGGNGIGTRLHTNGGAFSFALTTALPRGFQRGRLAPADYDRNGTVDLAIARLVTEGNVTRLYRNTPGGYVDSGTALDEVKEGELAWADYDSDGDLDLLASGYNGVLRTTNLYRQGPAGFTKVPTTLPNLNECAFEWGDFDSDGDPDLVIVGNRFPVSPTVQSWIYRNDGGTLVDHVAGLPGSTRGEVAWADIDNDGDLDLAHMGGSGGSGLLKIYQNNGGVFTDVGGPLDPTKEGKLAWGDMDGDGDPDLAVVGADPMGPSLKIYRNLGNAPNLLPTAPSAPDLVVSGSEVTFSWGASSDTETPTAGLTYALRVGSSPGTQDVLSAESNLTTGKRLAHRVGNVQQGLDHTLTLPDGTYYWGVQGVDSGYAGSPFVTGQGFKIPVEAQFDVAAQSPGEASGVVTLRLVLSSKTDTALTVPFTVSGSALNPADHDLVNGSFSFGVGDTAAITTFTIQDDAVSEGNETVVVTLGTPSVGALGPNQIQTVTIMDNEPPIVAQLDQASQSVGEAGGVLTLRVVISAPAASAMSVPFTVSGTAAQPADHDLINGAFAFAIGQTAAVTTFTIQDDVAVEPAETIVVTLAPPTIGILGGTTVQTVTITDNDFPPAPVPTPVPASLVVQIDRAAQTVGESAGGVSVQVMLSAPAPGSLTVPFSVSGSASQPADHDLSGGVLQFAAGEVVATIDFSVTDDSESESAETVVISLGAPSTGSLGAIHVQTCTIIDNDAAPPSANAGGGGGGGGGGSGGGCALSATRDDPPPVGAPLLVLLLCAILHRGRR